MNQNDHHSQDEKDFKQSTIRVVLRTGVVALVLSALLLIASALLTAEAQLGEGNWGLAIAMMASRTCGIAAFLCGAALLLLEQWTAGTLILLAAIVLPCISLLRFGTI